MKKSFSLIELVIVLVVIGILYSSINFSLSDNSLRMAASQLISHINYTRHLAIKDNKMQYYPINNSAVEMNRSKYWFKQWWQLRISKNQNGDIFYEIFSDFPTDADSTNFDQKGLLINEFAKNPSNDKYLDGNYAGSNEEEADARLNLTNYYKIVKVIINDNGNIYNIASNKSFRIIFDHYGDGYLSEGIVSDGGDTNPYDMNNRKPLLNPLKISLCKDDNCEKNISICLSAKIGNIYYCK